MYHPLRYDASRPRTSSYSSRSSLTSNQVVSSSIQSPGGATPGSVTPRGAAGSRSSRSRFVGDYYDQAIDYPTERHFRSYDEYSQGSAASHDDVIVYEHEYTFVHDSPTHLDVLDSRSMQSIVVETVSSFLHNTSDVCQILSVLSQKATSLFFKSNFSLDVYVRHTASSTKC